MIAIIGAILMLVVITISILLLCGLPLGELTMDGQYRVFPKKNENKGNLIAYALEMAKKDSNQKALDELGSLGDLPYDKTDFGSKICLYAEALIRPEYSLKDFIYFLKGEDLYYSDTERDQARWELFNANLHEEIPSVEIPIYFIQGENDFITSYEACEEYFYMLQAPYKELIPISECAHNPIVEKIDDVSDILINKVLLGH